MAYSSGVYTIVCMMQYVVKDEGVTGASSALQRDHREGGEGQEQNQVDSRQVCNGAVTLVCRRCLYVCVCEGLWVGLVDAPATVAIYTQKRRRDRLHHLILHCSSSIGSTRLDRSMRHILILCFVFNDSPAAVTCS